MSLFNPKNISISDEFERQRFLLIWRFSLVFFFAFFLLTCFFFFVDLDGVLPYAAATLVCGLSVLYLYKSQKAKIVYIIYSILGTGIIHLSLHTVADIPHAAEFLWIIFTILVAFFGLGRSWGIGILAVNVILTTYFIFSVYHYHLIKFKGLFLTQKIILSVELSVCFALITYIVYQFIKSREKANDLLLQQNVMLEKSNKLVRKQNQEKTILVKEIHHRVKNNLQIIISLLRLQSNEMKSTEARKHFKEAINRVMVMSSVHQKLYQETDVADFDLQNYILELTKELKDFYKQNYPIEIIVTANYHKVNLKTIVPMGLILNELISNSLKYAFDSQTSGEIKITVNKENDELVMTYSDNGKWVEPSEDESGFGTELIDLLTEQLNGNKDLEINEKGTHYTFSFEEINKSSEE